jgi:recombinational DNA repair ATPase RecF
MDDLYERFPSEDAIAARFQELEQQLAAAETELQAERTKYYELLYAVATKWDNETRHETALRYIKERENRPSEPAQDTAHAEGKHP